MLLGRLSLRAKGFNPKNYNLKYLSDVADQSMSSIIFQRCKNFPNNQSESGNLF